MGQEYSTEGINSISYPEAIGYIERYKFKGKNKYPMKKAEIKSFSKIPYSKYVPLGDRSSDTYRRSLKGRPNQPNSGAGSPDKRPGGRIVSIAPPHKIKGSPILSKRPNNDRVAHSGKQKAVKPKQVKTKSQPQNSSYTTDTSKHNREQVTSPNTSVSSIKEIIEKNITTPHEPGGKKSKFVPQSNKEAQLQRIYIKPEDLVVEQQKKKSAKNRKTNASSASSNNKPTSGKKKKALFKIRKKMKIEPEKVYIESPFKRQKTIRIKKNQIAPGVQLKLDGDQAPTTKSRPGTSESRRPGSSVSTIPSRPTSKGASADFSIVGTKVNLFPKDADHKVYEDNENDIEEKLEVETDDLMKLFTKRTHLPPHQPKIEKKLERPQTASLDDLRDPDRPQKKRQKSKQNRPASSHESPYKGLPYFSNTVIFPAYKGRSAKNNQVTVSKHLTEPKKYSSKALPRPTKSGKFRAKVGPLTIVKGKKKNATSSVKPDASGGKNDPKVRLKWFNVLHRSHYQNHVDSLYDNDEDYIPIDESFITKHLHKNEAQDQAISKSKDSVVKSTSRSVMYGSSDSESDDDVAKATNLHPKENVKNSGDEDSDATLKNEAVGSDVIKTEEERSLNTYTDSFLTNTSISSANAIVLGNKLERNMREVEYEPSVTSEFSVFSTRQSRPSGVIEYDGDGETDLDRPLRFKSKKSPQVLRKHMMQNQEAYFRNHPGLEQETDTDSDTDTLTGENALNGHVQKMRALFGALQHNQTQPRQKPRSAGNNEQRNSRTDFLVDKENTSPLDRRITNDYQPSFMNNNNPSHLFSASNVPKKQPIPKSPHNKHQPIIVNKTENKLQILSSDKSTVSVHSNVRSKSSTHEHKPKSAKKSVSFHTPPTGAQRLKSSPYGPLVNSKTSANSIENKSKPVKPLPFLNKKTPKFLQQEEKSNSIKNFSSKNKGVNGERKASPSRVLSPVRSHNKGIPPPRKSTASPTRALSPVRQIVVTPLASPSRPLGSPVHTDTEDDSLANLEDAETLAAQLKQSQQLEITSGRNSQQNKGHELDVKNSRHVMSYSPNSFLNTQTNINDYELNDELDQVLNQILNESKHRELQSTNTKGNLQQNGVFKMETATSPFVRPLNPIRSYSKTPNALNQTFNLEAQNTPTPLPLNQTYTFETEVPQSQNDANNGDIRRSKNFKKIRQMYETLGYNQELAREPSTLKPSSETTIKDGVVCTKPFYQNKASSSKDAEKAPGFEDDPSGFSSTDQSKVIEGNYDSYARRAKDSSPTSKVPDVEHAEKGAIYLPQIVDKEAFQIYSRHGPIASKGGPKLSTKVTHSKSLTKTYNINTVENSTTWKAGNVGSRTQNGSLYETIIQGRHRATSPSKQNKTLGASTKL